MSVTCVSDHKTGKLRYTLGCQAIHDAKSWVLTSAQFDSANKRHCGQGKQSSDRDSSADQWQR